MHNLLLIDDDDRLAALLTEYFQRFDLNLINDTHPQQGIDRLAEDKTIELVILDVMLPDMDGFEVCRTIRKTNDIPILMLTARGDVMDRIVGLEIGADDYLSKPFEPRELVARIHNIFKRLNKEQSQDQESDNSTLTFGALVIDTHKHTATVDDTNLSLTSKEFALLQLFAENPGKKFDRDEIMNELSGIDAELFSRSIDILVSRLRNKLKPLDCIQTVWGKGYRFVTPDTKT